VATSRAQAISAAPAGRPLAGRLAPVSQWQWPVAYSISTSIDFR
jgi:hypothetical protein